MKSKILYFVKESIGLVLFMIQVSFNFKGPRVLSVYFHNPSPHLFERIIKYLHKKSYRFISLNQLNEIIDSKTVHDKIAIITIDDGWQKNQNLLEISIRYKVYITIFITTSAIEDGNFWWEYVGMGTKLGKKSIKREIIRIKQLEAKAFFQEVFNLKSGGKIPRSALTREELIRLSKEEYITIGSHTVNHFSMFGRPSEVQKQELLTSKITLESLTNKAVDYFSYPGGDYDEGLKKLTEECGYVICFTTETNAININRIDKYSFPRRSVNDDAGFFEALSKIYGIWYKLFP